MASPSISYGVADKYSVFDVFINHRGPDVKKGLATNLYRRLSEHGLKAFLDSEELQPGDSFPPQIEGAIRTASLHIAIFSPGYAESAWCLNELVQMIESGKTILPVFYNIKPSELRWTQGGNGLYARALRDLEAKTTFESQPRYDSRTLQNWREALSVAAEITGFELSACNGDEGQLVHKVVERVCEKVGKTALNVAKYPTGVADKANDFEATMLSQQESEKSTVVGIVGLGGLGKTTLAKEIFNRQRAKYDKSCFLFDVRENEAKGSLNLLQSTLLRELAQLNKHISSIDEGIEELKKSLSPAHRVLIVLDDVDKSSQLDALFFPIKHIIHSCSLVLVTSRDKDLLKRSGIAEPFIYKQTGLNQQHSQELFCLHAFNHPYPRSGFKQLVEEFLDICHGLPLSLKVIGALLLCYEDLKYWEAQLDKISEVPPEDIRGRLKISYDNLEYTEKQIFLDVACFFIGEDRDTAIRIWDGTKWYGWLGLQNLENKCLLEVDSEKRIKMHDQLRDLGRGIAKEETQHRLWRSDDNLPDQLSVRGISMVQRNGPQQCFEIPTNMRGLQLLRVGGDSVERIVRVTQPPPQLLWLSWYNCPFPALPCWISLKNLRVLHIEGRGLETLWQHESQAPLQLMELYIETVNTFNFPKSIGTLKQLEKFVLRHLKEQYGMLKLVDVDTFLLDEVGGIHSLKHLELHSYENIKLLPHSAGNWNQLQYIRLQDCRALQGLLESAGGWTNLQHMDLRDCRALQGLPESAGGWTNLQRMDLRGCQALQGLPESAGGWTNLQHMDLRGCEALQGLPESAGGWTNLQRMDLSGCGALQGLPESAGGWTNLQHMDLSGCWALQGLPESAGGWTNLQHMDLSECHAVQGLPESAGGWTNLQHMDLSECHAVQGLPESAGGWTNLQHMDLRGCHALQGLPESAGGWTNLQHMDMGQCYNLPRLPESAGGWTNLQHMDLRECHALQRLPESAGGWINLQHMDLCGCEALHGLPESAGGWTNLQHMNLHGCYALQGLPESAGGWTNLQHMDLRGCWVLQGLPELAEAWTNFQLEAALRESARGWTNLQHMDMDMDMYLGPCAALQELPEWTNLRYMDLCGCSNLELAGEVLVLLRQRLKSKLLI